MRAALDTNVLIYAEEQSEKGERARRLMVSLSPRRTVLPVQVCGEIFHVLTRKGGFAKARAVATIHNWRAVFQVAETTEAVLSGAFELAADHHFPIWDAIILAAAADTQCDLLLSEDFHPGFRWRGVTLVNPFAEPSSPLLDAFLDQGR